MISPILGTAGFLGAREGHSSSFINSQHTLADRTCHAHPLQTSQKTGNHRNSLYEELGEPVVQRRNCLSGVSREKLKSLLQILLHKNMLVNSYYTGGCQGNR